MRQDRRPPLDMHWNPVVLWRIRCHSPPPMPQPRGHQLAGHRDEVAKSPLVARASARTQTHHRRLSAYIEDHLGGSEPRINCLLMLAQFIIGAHLPGWDD